MKKQFLVIFFLLFANLLVYSQVNTDIIRQKTYGGSSADYFIKAVQTNDGGYLVGVFSTSDISGDKTVPARGNYHIWLLKLNNNLTIQWQKSIGGSDFDRLSDILMLDDGSFLLLASSDSPISLDKTVENYGIYDIWLIHIDSVGNILQQQTYGGSNNNHPVKIIKINNNYLIAGMSDSDISGVKTENSRGHYDFWFLLIDDSFQIIYDKTLGGSSLETIWDVVYDNTTENLFLYGSTSSNISGDITNSPYGFINDYLLFICSAVDGQLVSDHRYGGSYVNNATALSKLNNHLYIGGYSSSDSSGVKTENLRGGQYNDFWVLKLNKDGSIVWDKTIGGNHVDILHNIETTADNQLLLIGSSMSDIGFEKTEPRIGGYEDFWIVSIDTNSNILWQKTLGGTHTDYPKQILVLGTNHYIIFGNSKSGISGHKTEANRGQEDIWILEISSNLSIENFAKKSLHILPNPAINDFSFNIPETSKHGILYIFNPSGSIVHSEKIENSNNIIDITKLSNGIYFVTFFDENGIGYSAKLVKSE